MGIIRLTEACRKEVKVYNEEILTLLSEKKYDDLYHEEILKLFAQVGLEISEPEVVVSGKEDLLIFLEKYIKVTLEMLNSLTEKKRNLSDFKINMYQNYFELCIESFSKFIATGCFEGYPYVENKSVFMNEYDHNLNRYISKKINSGIFKEKL